MISSLFRNVTLCLLILPCLILFSHRGHCTDPDPVLRFIENKNQWTQEIRFAADIPSGKVNFMNDRFRFYFFAAEATEAKEPGKHSFATHAYHDDGSHDHRTITNVHIYDVRFIGVNPNSKIAGQKQLITHYNFFSGNDPNRWASHASSFSRIRYTDAYPGIDMDVYSQDARMKYEWKVAPGADPGQIRMDYDGVDEISQEDGNLLIRTSVNTITELEPYAYQFIAGKQVQVKCDFRLTGHVVAYVFPEGYDHCEELIIDPILIFSAYSGSFLDNWGNTATYDSRGNVYSGGMVLNTAPTGFPVTPGAYQLQSGGGDWDVGILKYDSAGSVLLYATYVGGNDTETPQSLVVNSKDELLILGATGSADFPVTNGTNFRGGTAIDPLGGVQYNQGTDIFVARLSEDGSQLLSGTYLGGTQNDGVNFVAGDMQTNTKTESPVARNYGDQLRGDIITGANDTVYIASNTRSSDFTGVMNAFAGGSHDAIIVKLAPDLSSIKSARYFGGNETDAAYSIKLKDGNIFVAGGTTSNNLPGVDGLGMVYQGNGDGWVAELSRNALTVTHATYLGTTSYDQAYFMDLNSAGEVYIFGQTMGQYPVLGNVYTNVNAGQFIHKLSANLKTTIFSTVVGSVNNPSSIRPNISPTAFLVSDCNHLYLSGWGGSINAQLNGNIVRNYVGGNTFNMPVSTGAFQTSTNGNDFYFMVLSADASQFLYGTYLGGTGSRTHVDGGTSRFDKQGVIYHAVCAGCGGASDFPAVNVPVEHSRNRSSNCNNAVFKFDLSLLKARIGSVVAPDSPGRDIVCTPDVIIFKNLSSGGEVFEWDLGDGTHFTKLDTTAFLHHYPNPGQYLVKLKVTDTRTCQVVDAVVKVITVFERAASVQDDDLVCEGDSYKLKASGGVSYTWSSADAAFTSHDAAPIVVPPDTTDYYVTVVDANGCITKDTVQLNVIPAIDPEFKVVRENQCAGRPFLHFTNTTDSLRADDTIFLEWGDGSATDQPDVVHHYEKDGVYRVNLVSSRSICVYEKSVEMPVFKLTLPNVITPVVPDEVNDTFTIQYGEGEGVTPKDYGFKVDLKVYNRWGRILFEENDYQYNWKGDGLAAGIYYYEAVIQEHATCKSWLHLLK